MTRSILILAAVALMAAGPAPGPASAPDHPVMAPLHDALIAYHVAPAAGEAIDLRVAFLAGAKQVRFNLPDTSYILVTPAKHSVTMVVPLQGTYATLPWDAGPQPLFLLNDHAQYTRKPETTVAGQKCTQWDVVFEQDHRSVCVTSDGLVLRNQSTDAQGRRNLVEATIVRVEAVPDGLFAIPDGYERIDPELGQTR